MLKLCCLIFVGISVVGNSAAASVTRNFTVALEGVRDGSLAKAKLSYLDACAKARSELAGTSLAPFVKSTVCASPWIQEGPTLYRATGGLSVSLKRNMFVESANLATGFVDNESEAQALWSGLCEEWKLGAGAKLVFQSCGQQLVDRFYVKPAISSTALRVSRVRVTEERGQYCKCRSRQVETREQGPWGRPIIRWKTVYDFMLLVEAGFYEKQETFENSEDCQDLVVKSPLCTEEE